MKELEFKDAMYDGLAKLPRALVNPKRLEIIEMLLQGEKCSGHWAVHQACRSKCSTTLQGINE